MNTLPTVRLFAPEGCGELDKFNQFYGQTHAFNSDVKKAIAGSKSHFNKAITLRDVAAKLAPNMQIDAAELQEKGFTDAANSREVSAVIEEVFTELYSSIDCTRKMIVAINCALTIVSSRGERQNWRLSSLVAGSLRRRDLA